MKRGAKRNRFVFILSSITLLGSIPAFAADSATDAAAASGTSSTTISGPGASSAPVEKINRLDLTTWVRGRFLEDKLVRSDTLGTLLILEGSHRFTRELSADMTFVGSYNSGAASNLVTDEGKPSSGTYLVLASLNYSPWTPVTFQFGLLDSSLFIPSFAGEGSSFPGLAQIGTLGGDDLKATLTLRELMPTSGGFSVRQQNGSDPVPGLLMNTLQLESKFARPFALQGSLTYFNFSNLAHGMADDSRVYGNTLLGVAKGVTFAYGFEGIEGRANFEFHDRKKDPWNIHAEVASIWNAQAPDGSNRGLLTSVGATYLFAPFRLSADLTYFMNQSDTVPATYSNSNTGYNNREGPGAQLRFDLNRVPIAFFGTYFHMNPMQANPYQADRSIVQIVAETKYAFY